MDEHKANITDFKREVCNYLDDVGNVWTVGIVIVASYIIYRLTRTIFALFCALSLYAIMPLFYRPNLKKYRHRWTVVTGATDGIGRAYTMELARRGLRKFVLIGRNSQKLADVRAQLASICASMTEQLSPLDVRTLQFDFFDGDFATLRAVLARLDVGLAVNSVGVGRELLERFGDNPTADSQLLRVNALGAAEFLSCVIPPMERNGGGQLVVLSSSQGVRPIPMLATYSASKSLLAFLCEAIDREYSTISCQCLIPALVATKMTYYKNSSLFVVTPQRFAYEAVNVLGVVQQTSGCLNHEIQMLLNHLFPWTLLKYLILPIYWRQQKRVLRLHEERVSQSATVLTEQPGGETKTSTESSEFIVENGCAEKEPFKKTTAESLSFTNCLKNKSKIPKTSLPALSLRQRG